MLEEQIVHLPERSLCGGRLGGLAAIWAWGWTSFSGRWRQT